MERRWPKAQRQGMSHDGLEAHVVSRAYERARNTKLYTTSS